jgi:outer membrane protein assembly factor BamB
VGPSERVVPEAAFLKALRARRTDVEAFVRDLYRARGWELETADDGFLAVRDGERRRVVVRREVRLPFVGIHSDAIGNADVVVVVDGTASAHEAAAAADARLVDGRALYRRVLYGIPRETAEGLCREHLDRSVTVTSSRWSGLRAGIDRTRIGYAALFVLSVALLLAGARFVSLGQPGGTAPGAAAGFEDGEAMTPVELPDVRSPSPQDTTLPSSVVVRPDDWPAFRGGPARIGVATRGSSPGEPATVQRYDRGVGSISSPVVASGWLYIGGFQGNLYALDADTMTENWTVSLSRWVTYSPAVGNNTVFVGGQNGTLYAVEATTGDLRWERSLSDRILRSSPVVWNGTVFIASNDGVHALRARTGRPLWNATSAGPSLSSPAVVNGTVFVAYYGGTVHALNATTGAERWRRELNSTTSTTPAVHNRTVYVGDRRGRFYAFSMETGKTRWSRRVTSEFRSSPAVWNGTVFVGSSDRRVYALDARSGVGVWNTTLGDIKWDRGEARPDSGIFSSPTVADGVVYVGSNDGRVYSLRAADGTVRWSVSTRGDVTASPAVVDGTVFIGSLDGGVYAIRGKNSNESTDSRPVPTGASESTDRRSSPSVRPTPLR